MARTLSGNLIGKAAQTALREQREEIIEAQQKFSDRWHNAHNFLVENMTSSEFETWWDSYPEQMSKRDFLPIMELKVEEIKSIKYVAEHLKGRDIEADADRLHELLNPVCRKCADGVVEIPNGLANCTCCHGDYLNCPNCHSHTSDVPHPVEEVKSQYECENCDGGSNYHPESDKDIVCPCCNGNWQDCQNCKPEGTGNDVADLLAGMR